jgi:hypothetical protein
MSYYHRRPKEALIPDLGGFQQQWINACKTGRDTACDFEYGGTLIEMMLLGLVAFRAGEKISYNGETGRVTNSAKADALLSKEYRKGWTMNG